MARPASCWPPPSPAWGYISLVAARNSECDVSSGRRMNHNRFWRVVAVGPVAIRNFAALLPCQRQRSNQLSYGPVEGAHYKLATGGLAFSCGRREYSRGRSGPPQPLISAGMPRKIAAASHGQDTASASTTISPRPGKYRRAAGRRLLRAGHHRAYRLCKSVADAAAPSRARYGCGRDLTGRARGPLRRRSGSVRCRRGRGFAPQQQPGHRRRCRRAASALIASSSPQPSFLALRLCQRSGQYNIYSAPLSAHQVEIQPEGGASAVEVGGGRVSRVMNARRRDRPHTLSGRPSVRQWI